MECQQWIQQWQKMARQEAELWAGCEGAGARFTEPASLGGHNDGSAAQHIRTQLSRHLSAAEALLAAEATPAAPALARRQHKCTAALATLQASCAAELEALGQAEVDLATAYETAAAQVHQTLAAAAGAASADQPAVSSTTLYSAAAATPSSDSLPAEVTALDIYLQRHGATGGWHPDDHAEFERILRACRGNYAHAAQLCAEERAPLHSSDEVQRHARWHEELQKLQLAKRLAVQRWRLQKQAGQAQALEQQEEPAREAADRQQQLAQDKAAENRQRQRAELEEWKREKEQQREEQRRRKEAEQREKQEREAQAWQQRQQENRQLLEQRRAQANADSQQQCLPSAETSGSSSSGSRHTSLDPAVQRRLQERTTQLLQRRSEQARRKAEEAAQQAARAEALQRRASQQVGIEHAVDRDPLRLLSATSAAAMRQLASLSEERMARDSGFIRNVARLATPAWCQGARLQ